MNKHAWFLVVIAVSLVALIGSAVGCAVTAPAVAKPTINSFAASPTGISQGERTTLSWNVAGVNTVTIEPGIGTVGSSGSLMVTPASNATYTLTATNAAGSDTRSVSVAVAPVVAGKPDLVITDVWLSGSMVNYKIANKGTAASGPSESTFYIGDISPSKEATVWYIEDTDWVEPLAAGEEISTIFPNLDWRYYIGANPEGASEIGYTIKLCTDTKNSAAESNEDNNCLTRIWKQGFTYDFLENAHLATWKSSNSVNNLRWPMVTEDDNGSVVRNSFSPYMTICPEQVSDGWILGRYGELYGEFGKTLMRAFTLPYEAQFTTKVGFAPGAKSSDGVKISLGYLDNMGSIVFFPGLNVQADGQLHEYTVDLSDMAGQKTEFFILVEANNSPDGDCLRVWEPKITQKGTFGTE